MKKLRRQPAIHWRPPGCRPWGEVRIQYQNPCFPNHAPATVNAKPSVMPMARTIKTGWAHIVQSLRKDCTGIVRILQVNKCLSMKMTLFTANRHFHSLSGFPHPDLAAPFNACCVAATPHVIYATATPLYSRSSSSTSNSRCPSCQFRIWSTAARYAAAISACSGCNRRNISAKPGACASAADKNSAVEWRASGVMWMPLPSPQPHADHKCG